MQRDPRTCQLALAFLFLLFQFLVSNSNLRAAHEPDDKPSQNEDSEGQEDKEQQEVQTQQPQTDAERKESREKLQSSTDQKIKDAKKEGKLDLKTLDSIIKKESEDLAKGLERLGEKQDLSAEEKEEVNQLSKRVAELNRIRKAATPSIPRSTKSSEKGKIVDLAVSKSGKRTGERQLYLSPEKETKKGNLVQGRLEDGSVVSGKRLPQGYDPEKFYKYSRGPDGEATFTEDGSAKGETIARYRPNGERRVDFFDSTGNFATNQEYPLGQRAGIASTRPVLSEKQNVASGTDPPDVRPAPLVRSGPHAPARPENPVQDPDDPKPDANKNSPVNAGRAPCRGGVCVGVDGFARYSENAPVANGTTESFDSVLKRAIAFNKNPLKETIRPEKVRSNGQAVDFNNTDLQKDFQLALQIALQPNTARSKSGNSQSAIDRVNLPRRKRRGLTGAAPLAQVRELWPDVFQCILPPSRPSLLGL